MLDGEEDGVQDDAEGHDHIKEGVIDHFVEEILKLQPHWIVYTASLTATTISVGTWLWIWLILINKKKENKKEGEVEITYWHHEGYVNFARFPLHLLLAVDDVALNVIDSQVVETVLVVVPNHAAVIDTGLAAVGVAAVLTHARAVMETHRGGGE